MQYPITSARLDELEEAVLRCIVYADLFDYPLTPEELRRWLPIAAPQPAVDGVLTAEPLSGLVSAIPPYVMLRGRESLIALRQRRLAASTRLRARAIRYGRLIARLPFVRMVSVTGSLAVDNAEDGDDLDYLIVTAPGRVWLTRSMVMAIGRLGALRGVTVCPNYLLSETALALRERDYYTARELLQMQPVAGEAVYERMLAANGWWREHLPNAADPCNAGETRTSLARRIAETVLRLPPFDAVERWILARKGAELRRQAGSEEALFDETMCKGHFDRWRERTTARLEERLRQVLLEDPS